MTTVTAEGSALCYGQLRRPGMDQYKLHREHRVPVGPNRLPRFIEVVTALVMVLAVIHLLN